MRKLVISAFALAIAALGCSKAEPDAHAQPHVDGRRVAIAATAEGYSPATVEAKAGEQLVLVFTRKTKSECLAKVVFPSLGITKDLPVDKPVEIPVKPEKAGDIKFQCGMAMVEGSIHVSGS